MTVAWTVQIDSAKDGSWATSLTADERGFTTQGGLIDTNTHTADIGVCYITLRDAAKYTPIQRAGFTVTAVPMAPIRIQANINGGGAFTVWQGVIRTVRPDWREDICTLECENALSIMERTSLTLPLQENRRADELYTLIASEVWRGDFADGKITIAALPAENDTVSVGRKTYTFVSSLSVAYDVLIGSDVNTTAANLAAAINNGDVEGTGAGEIYSDNTFRSDEVAASAASAVVTVTCLYRGTPGNEIALSTTSGNVTLSGATLANGADAPAGLTSFETGSRLFTVAGDRWNEDYTSAMNAVSDVTLSEFGYFWVARDGTLTAKNRYWRFALPATTPAMTIENEGVLAAPGSMSDAAIANRVIVQNIPRREESGVVIAKANNTIVVPGKVDDETWERWTRETGLPGAAATNALPPGVLTIRLPFVADDNGRRIGAKDIITPIRGADFQINDALAGNGFDYTTNPNVRITCSVVVTGSGVEVTFLNTAYRTLYVFGFQVRGTAIISYDPVEVIREDQDSIDIYNVRTKRIMFPLDAGDEIPIAVANFTLSQYKTPKYEIDSLFFKDATRVVGGTTPLELIHGDVLNITLERWFVETDLYMVRGVELTHAVSDEGTNTSAMVYTRALSNSTFGTLTFWILGNATYGVLGSTTILAL